MYVLILIYPKCKYHKKMQEETYIGMTMHPLGLPNIQQHCFRLTNWPPNSTHWTGRLFLVTFSIIPFAVRFPLPAFPLPNGYLPPFGARPSTGIVLIENLLLLTTTLPFLSVISNYFVVQAKSSKMVDDISWNVAILPLLSASMLQKCTV